VTVNVSDVEVASVEVESVETGALFSGEDDPDNGRADPEKLAAGDEIGGTVVVESLGIALALINSVD
jgi:hypothetical protein